MILSFNRYNVALLTCFMCRLSCRSFSSCTLNSSICCRNLFTSTAGALDVLGWCTGEPKKVPLFYCKHLQRKTFALRALFSHFDQELSSLLHQVQHNTLVPFFLLLQHCQRAIEFFLEVGVELALVR